MDKGANPFIFTMIKKILKFLRPQPKRKEIITKYPIILETRGVLESSCPTVDTAYGTITYIYEDGTRKIFNK